MIRPPKSECGVNLLWMSSSAFSCAAHVLSSSTLSGDGSPCTFRNTGMMACPQAHFFKPTTTHPCYHQAEIGDPPCLPKLLDPCVLLGKLFVGCGRMHVCSTNFRPQGTPIKPDSGLGGRGSSLSVEQDKLARQQQPASVGNTCARDQSCVAELPAWQHTAADSRGDRRTPLHCTGRVHTCTSARPAAARQSGKVLAVSLAPRLRSAPFTFPETSAAQEPSSHDLSLALPKPLWAFCRPFRSIAGFQPRQVGRAAAFFACWVFIRRHVARRRGGADQQRIGSVCPPAR